MDREPQTILIVNDAPDQLSLLSTALGKAGYRTLTVRDGEEAYRLAARERPALVVSDVTTARAD
ncbi:MAG: Response regulator receiver domain, partial [Acidobacteriota bacterium]|nr:Response regulator receiver domain [Acidobacteriota bacterium]